MVAMEVIYQRSTPISSLNPNAAPFVPLAHRKVEDFSEEWWALVQSSPWFRDYWIQEKYQDPQNDSAFGDIYDPVLPDLDDLFDDMEFQDQNQIQKQDDVDRRKDLIKIGSMKWNKGRSQSQVPRYLEKTPKIVNVKLSPRPIQQPR